MDITLRELGESTSDILFVYNKCKDEISYVNGALEDVLGTVPAEAKTDLDVLLKSFNKKNRLALKKIIAGPDSQKENNIELKLKQAKNQECWLRCRTFPCKDKMAHEHTVVMLSEVTKFKRASAKLDRERQILIQNDKLASLGTLIAGIAHEINNPLGYIKSNLHTLSAFLQDIDSAMKASSRKSPILPAVTGDLITKEMPELLQETLEGISRVEDIVSNLKCFARPADEKQKSEDANLLIDNALSIVWNELKHNCSIEKDYADGPYILCNKNQMIQVLVNLLLNAKQAMQNPPHHLSLSTAKNHSQVIISVKDNGIGMSSSQKKKIFEPFYTTKPIGKGTGLGLSVAHSIIQKFNGTITVNSKAGTGTEINIILPLQKTA